MMTMTQEEREAAIQRASGYREMMKGWAWKDFEKILDAIRLNALEGAIQCKDISDVQLQRGRVLVIDEIKSTVAYILEPI